MLPNYSTGSDGTVLLIRKLFMNKNWSLGIIAAIAALVAPSLPANAKSFTSPFKQKVDFNGDGKADAFWYNDQTGDTSAWLINGTSVNYTNYANVSPSSGWRVMGYGDFNGDGKTDVFWYNTKTGDTSAWLIDGGSVISYTNYGNVSTSSGWFPLFAHPNTGLAIQKIIIP